MEISHDKIRWLWAGIRDAEAELAIRGHKDLLPFCYHRFSLLSRIDLTSFLYGLQVSLSDILYVRLCLGCMKPASSHLRKMAS